MSEECISVSCPRCGLTLTDIVNDSIRKQLDALQSRIDDLENAWFVDESIQSDGSLRPSLLDTINRTKQEESERDTLQAKLDIAVEALKPFANEDNWMWGGETDCGYPYSPDWVGNDEPWKSAQEALKRLEE